MWILPKNYPLSSHFAQDMVASKEDLTLPGLNIEQSLMSRSKPTRLRTWQTRWKEGSFYPAVYGRILKPCQWSRFETELTSLHLAIHVNPLVQQETDLEKKTQDTYGLTSGDTLKQLDLFGASLKTSKDTSVLDSEKSLAIWKASVIEQRGEYSVRVKLALLTRESESISWATPRACSAMSAQITQKTAMAKFPNLETQVARSMNWATPRTTDSAGGARTLNEKGQRISVSDPTKTYGANLSDQVRHWPTPSARDHKGGYQGGRIRNGKVSLDTLDVAAQHYSGDKNKVGHLNPDWVEWLMGVPTGWTEYDYSEMA